ncbi:MAG: hypothetical protein CVU29_11300 [Betaproteobacteria bacterium HGW-Betaproteobacteria-22]|nr:MAG: hypothetical protein CVU29_11300 [Betaproteobacteria bacterium HGW-Betaproteobacteria-22]
MIKMHCFNEAYQLYQQQKMPFRILQDQSAVMLGLCQQQHSQISNPLEITQADIDWLIQQSEAIQDYIDYLGGYVYIFETEADLLQIHGCDFEWAETHNGNWPNVTDIAMSWDACNYLDETIGEPQWVIFLLCWNNAGGPVYYVPKNLWHKARVTEHIEATSTNSNI